MSSRRRSQGPPEPEKVEDAFSTETLNQLAEERMRDIKHIVVYRRRVPSRETVEAYPQTVHVSLDAGGVVGRMLIDNAISPNEHEALLGWYDRGFDKGFAREYAGDATDSFSGNLSQRLTVDRWDLTRQKCSYKTEGDQRDKTTYVMEFDGVNTTIAETVLRLYAARIRKIMDLVVNEDPRVRYAEDGEGDAAEPVGEPCDKASANDARSGGGDGVRARATALTDDLAENFEDPEAIQLTTYQPRPQSGMAQHFDSRSRFLSIATMSLRASVKLVQIRAASRGPKDGMQRSEIRLLPRSIYLMSGPARANCHLKDEPNVQAQGNHKGCPCCWTHGIDTDQTEAQGRIGVTFRQLAPWALHEAELKRLADERAERDKAAEEGALQPRRRSTPATKRDAPTGPATWLSTAGADAVREWRSTLTPDAWDALAAADGLTLNNVPARGWHREVKAAGAPLPPAPKPRVASTASDWVAACTDLLELAAKEKGGLTGLRGELGSRGFRCGEPKREGVKEFDVSMPQEFPCYYDIVGKSYSGGRQDLMSSKPGLVAYLEGCIALAQAGSAYRTTADRDADGDEAARRAGKRTTKAVVCFHRPGQFKASDALRSRSAVERYLAADATPLFEAPALDAFSFETDVAGDFPSPPPGYYSRLSAKVVAQLRPAAPALTAASPAVVSPPAAAPPAVGAESESEIDEPVVESDGEGDPDWDGGVPAKEPRGAPKGRAPKGSARPQTGAGAWVDSGPRKHLALGGAEAVRSWRSTLTPDAWDALAADDGLTRNNVPARGWHRELKLRKASISKCDIIFHAPGQLVGNEALRSNPEISQYLAANVTPRFEAPRLDDFSFARDDDPAMFPSPPEGYYARLRSRVQELLRPASAALPPAAPALPPSAMALPPAASAPPPPPPAVAGAAAAPLLQHCSATGDWRIIGAQVQDVDDSTVRGVIVDCPKSWKEVATTTGSLVIVRATQLTQATLTDDEAARCVRPASKKDYVQARIDGAIRFTHGREFKNCYTCADGTERRQFTVTATHIRCALCGDAKTWSLETDTNELLSDLKRHCGHSKNAGSVAQRQHLDRLVQSAGAPPPTAEASTTPVPTPAAPAPPPPRPQNGRPQAVAASQRFAVDDLVQADFHAQNAYYDGVVVAARADGEKGFLYRIEYDDGDDEDDVPEERIRPAPKKTLRTRGSVWVGRRLKANANARSLRSRSEGRIVGWLPVRGVKEPFLNAAGRPAPIYRVDYGGGRPDELETYELLDESTLLPPQTSEEWQRETAFAEFLRERDVACKFSSSRPRELTARALYDRYAGAETLRAFFELGGTAEALVKELCQERCTIENVDALWSEYCAQTLDEGAERKKPEPVRKPKAKKRARKPAAAPPASIVAGAHVQAADEEPSSARRVGGVVIPAKKVRGPPEPWEGLAAAPPAPKPSVKREPKPAPSPHDWVAVGSHVQHSNGLRGVVTKSGGAGFTDVTTKTGYVATVHRQDLTKISLTAEEAALCDRFRLQPHEWLQAQMDGAICAVYEGREFGNCFATKTGRPQRMFTVESNGDVRCALCDWTAPERASTAMQNDLSTWKRLFPSLKTHCGQTPSSLSKPAVKRHVERVVAMAAEPSSSALSPPTPSPPAITEPSRARRVVDGEVMPAKRARGPPNPPATALAEPTTPASLLQAQIDEAICIRDDDGQTFRNCFTSCDGTEMRQFVVSATGDVRCAICCGGAPFALSSRKPLVTKMHDIKKHCGQYESQRSQPQTRAHLERLRLLARAPPRVEASAAPVPPPPSSTVEVAAAPRPQPAAAVTGAKFPKPRGPAPKTEDGVPATWDSDRGEWTGVTKQKAADKRDWPIGAHVEDADDSAVRGVVIDWSRGFREIATTTGSVVMIRPSKLSQATLTDEEAARCVRPASRKDYVQARIDGVIRCSHGGREFKNCYTCADGTELRQFDVTPTHVRCALCGDAKTWSLETDCSRLLDSIKMHCGQGCPNNKGKAHLDRLVQSAGAPPPAAAAPAKPAAKKPRTAPQPEAAAPPAAAPGPPAEAGGQTSRFNGVKRVPVQGGKWRAEIIVQGHKIPLGNFDVEEDAARAYDAARSLWQTLMVYVKCPLNFPGEAPLAWALAALPPLPSALQAPAPLPPRRRSTPPPAPAPAVSPSPAPAEPPRAPAPDETIRVGMVVEASPHVWGAEYAEKVGSAKRYRGTVKARDSGDRLPTGCPAPWPGEPVWLVSYEDDGKDWATPERFLRIVAPVDGQRAGRERTKPQFLSGCVDAGRAYVPAQDEDNAPGAPAPPAALPTPPPPAAPAPVVSPAPAPAVLPAPSPPRAPSPPAAGRICVGAVVAAESQVWGKGFVRKVGATKRFRGIVKARGNGDILPVGCPPPAEGERIWRVFYADDREDYDTPERFLDFVAPPGRVFIGAVVEAAPAAFGHDSTNSVAARYRGTVVEPGEAFNLPLGCPPIEPGEPVWNVRYYDDGKVWATPERFLSCAVVASGSSKRRRCSDNSTAVAAAEAAPPPLTTRRVGGEVMPAKKARGPPEPWEDLVSTTAAPRPSVKRERKPDPRNVSWVAVGTHVQHSNGLRGVVTQLGKQGHTEVTTRTGYSVTVYRTDLTKITLTAEEATLCDRFRLQPHEWLQAQMDGAVCAVYEGRTFGNCFATKDGRTQRTFTVDSNGDVRCALCDWTAPERASTAMQNDLSTWKRLFHCLKGHCGQFASAQNHVGTGRHVERVLAMAAEPSTPRTATTSADDDGETPEPPPLTAPAAPAVPPRPPTPAAPPRPPTPFRLPTRSDYGDVPPTTRLRKRSPPPPDEVAWSPPPRPEHARQTKKPRRFVEVDQDVPAGAWREGSPRAASPSLVLAAPSSAAFVPATRWPEAGEECEFLVVDDHTHQWYLGHCVEATEARVVLNYNASKNRWKGVVHEFYKDDDKPAECIRLREDAPELPANIV